MDTVIRDKALELIKASVWNTAVPELNSEQAEAVYQIFKSHAIPALPENVLPQIPSFSDDLRKKWRNDIVHIIQSNYLITTAENEIISILDSQSIRFVIIKGTSAARYYPSPDLRALGDIDIVVNPEDFDKACGVVLNSGSIEKTDQMDIIMGRHRCFQKNNVEIEIHRFFALPENSATLEKLDRQLINGINSTHRLESIIDGLILLEHINQHFFEGIGLRHILDWMMFADKCLNNDNWPEYIKGAESVGLAKLAESLSSMCEIYLGLKPQYEFNRVNAQICEELLDYILLSGNFGSSPEWKKNSTSRFISKHRNPVEFFKFLQVRGLETWKNSDKHKFLKHFAWVYQSGLMLKNYFSRDHSDFRLNKSISNLMNTSKLFSDVGVSHSSLEKSKFDADEYVKSISN